MRLVLVACLLSGAAYAGDLAPDSHETAYTRNATRLVEALVRRDMGTVVSMLSPTLVPRIWFPSKACNDEFFGKLVERKRAKAFATCLADLELTWVGLGVFLYAGPFSVSATFKKGKLTNLWTDEVYKDYYASEASSHTWTTGHADIRPPSPTAGPVRAKLRTCIDETGAITTVVRLLSSDPKIVYDEDYAKHVATTARATWKLAPLVYQGASAKTCFDTEHSYPKEFRREQMEPRSTQRRVVAHPDGERTAVAVRVCVDGAGKVTSAKAPEHAKAWGREVERAVATWSFTPFVVGSDGWPMCGDILVSSM